MKDKKDPFGLDFHKKDMRLKPQDPKQNGDYKFFLLKLGSLEVKL